MTESPLALDRAEEVRATLLRLLDLLADHIANRLIAEHDARNAKNFDANASMPGEKANDEKRIR
jgi:hypothetical protein